MKFSHHVLFEKWPCFSLFAKKRERPAKEVAMSHHRILIKVANHQMHCPPTSNPILCLATLELTNTIPEEPFCNDVS